ncbi:hypothetical protein DD235_13080 [Corticimicrobacter populi]|uniref:GGDEF domain-containing protein n=1 Tax=Corticimicrobacter populi TaxID=2175229 RepID=A0A2V1JYZ4_9BURK|nr:hypothetical protein DD235_13080 [Corticimicrobacter populi]
MHRQGTYDRQCAGMADVSSKPAKQDRCIEHIHGKVMDMLPVAVFVVDEHGSILYANPESARLFGRSLDVLSGSHIAALLSRSGFVNEDKSQPWAEFAARHINRDETWHWLRETNGAAAMRMHIARAQPESHYLVCIEELLLTEQFPEHVKGYDLLTNLPNRHMAEAHLRRLRRQLRADNDSDLLYYLLIDIDNFRHINNTLGHHVGDQVLLTAARRFSQCCSTGEFLARLESDEFVVIIQCPAETALIEILDKLIACLSEPFVLGRHHLDISATITANEYTVVEAGLMVLTLNTRTMLDQAQDATLQYQRFFTQETAQQIYKNIAIAKDIEEALDKNEFFLEYQPQVCASSGQLVGAEALIRWNHRRYGRLSPAEFVPIAEETRKIILIGDWVLQKACEQLAILKQATGRPFRISVNITPDQVQNPGFCERVFELLAMYHLDPHSLELEITETTLVSEVESVRRALSALNQRGVSIALDDFGTGYSSLSHLAQFPVSRLKIDRSFISMLPDNDHHAALVGALISMGRKMGLKVVAEGVETWAQRDWLLAQGCHELQGYLFAKPLGDTSLLARITAEGRQ